MLPFAGAFVVCGGVVGFWVVVLVVVLVVVVVVVVLVVLVVVVVVVVVVVLVLVVVVVVGFWVVSPVLHLTVTGVSKKLPVTCHPFASSAQTSYRVDHT